MRKLLAALAALLLLVASPALAEQPESAEEMMARQAQVDAALMAEAEAGYDFENPLVVLNPYGNAPLSALAVFTTPGETGGTVTVRGKSPEDDIAGSFLPSKVHFVPILGLYADEENEVELRLDDGRSVTLRVQTESVQLDVSDFRVEMCDASAYDYGKITILSQFAYRAYAGVDSKGDLRWALLNNVAEGWIELDGGRMVLPTGRSGAGVAWWADGLHEIDGLGRIYNEYVFPSGNHHDAMRLPNGNYLSVGDTPGVPDSEDYLAEIDPDTGEVVWSLALEELIDRTDGGAFGRSDLDWAHINSVAYDADRDLLLISCRHLSAVVAIHKSEKTLAWVLGDPVGWEKLDPAYLLTPVGENFAWQYAQHRLSILSDGTLLLYDNGYGGRAKVANADAALTDAQNYSRVVRYRIDPEAMTVEQVWEYGRERGARRYAESMSGVECLDEASETYFITDSGCKAEFDEIPDNEGVRTYMSIVQGGETVWELSEAGYTYRAFRANLYDALGGFDVSAPGRLFEAKREG